MHLSIAPLYVGPLVLLYIWLATRVALYRKSSKVSFGDGDDRELLRRTRAHGNCAEYMPIGVVLLVIVELTGAPALVVHLLGVALVLSRVMHAYAFVVRPMNYVVRRYGMLLNLGMMLVTGLGIFFHALL